METEKLAKAENVTVVRRTVIYHLLDAVGEMLGGLAPESLVEDVYGEAEVRQVFDLSDRRGNKANLVAGVLVNKGSLDGDEKFRVLRDGKPMHEGTAGRGFPKSRHTVLPKLVTVCPCTTASNNGYDYTQHKRTVEARIRPTVCPLFANRPIQYTRRLKRLTLCFIRRKVCWTFRPFGDTKTKCGRLGKARIAGYPWPTSPT